ncbi:MAG: phosphatase PAP2 family protein, partial [Mycobacterium sp.]
ITFWRGVSRALSPATLRIVAVVAIVVALIRRRPRIGAFLGATVILMGLVIVGAKGLSDRPRPATALAFESSTSFPSGHALGITVAVLAFTTVLWPSLKPALRVPVVVLDVGLILLVGLSRVALNVHHPTDVVAGWTLGLLYYLLCLALVPPSRV